MFIHVKYIFHTRRRQWLCKTWGPFRWGGKMALVVCCESVSTRGYTHKYSHWMGKMIINHQMLGTTFSDKAVFSSILHNHAVDMARTFICFEVLIAFGRCGTVQWLSKPHFFHHRAWVCQPMECWFHSFDQIYSNCFIDICWLKKQLYPPIYVPYQYKPTLWSSDRWHGWIAASGGWDQRALAAIHQLGHRSTKKSHSEHHCSVQEWPWFRSNSTIATHTYIYIYYIIYMYIYIYISIILLYNLVNHWLSHLCLVVNSTMCHNMKVRTLGIYCILLELGKCRVNPKPSTIPYHPLPTYQK